MSIAIPVLDRVLEIGNEILKRAIPDPTQRAAAELELYRARQAGELDAMRVQISAILAEAGSADPWTSRARPSFMYVMYVMILASIPVGVAHVFNPGAVAAFTAGVTAWLNAIPEELWWLFGAGYLGYTGARSLEKRKGAAR